MRAFFVPAILVLLILPAHAQDRTRQRSGGFVGIRFVESEKGLKVESVLRGSPAQKAGFRAGDTILEITGQSRRKARKAPSPLNGDHFLQVLWMSRQVTMKILRGGKKIDLETSIQDLDRTMSVGEKAPGFTLTAPDGKSETALSDLVGGKPVVLIFGSYT
jgi:S1-C subfamily serine protease